MAVLVVSLIVLSLITCVSCARVELAAKDLYTHLMIKKQYNPLIKPSGDAVGKLTVKLGMRLHGLLDVDEKNQVISLKVKLHHEWRDLRLRWIPEEYGGVKMLFIPSNTLWRPDIVLYNNADGEFAITIKTKATVHYDGRVVWEPVAIYKSYCPINVEFFPFDIQKCFLKFSSWTYNGDEVDLQHMCDGMEVSGGQIIPDGIDISHYYKNSEWKLINITARRQEKFYACCPEPFPDITFFITIQRHPLFFTLNLIMPCVSISCLTVLVFYLPSDSREKISLSISILLALTVFFLLLSEINPPTSFVVPLIGKYLLFVMIVVTMSIFLTVYTLHINFKTPTTHKMSPWVRRVFTEILPKILLIKRPDYKRKREVSEDTKHGIEMKEAPETTAMLQDWQVYENARPRSGARPKNVGHYSQDVRDAFKGVEFIADHMKSADKDLAEIRDWKYVAMVIDRFFLFIFTAATFSGTLSIFLCAPSLYDDRQELYRNYNTSCIF